jgi:cobalt-zinc-cadmium efflux system outer membrane protein
MKRLVSTAFLALLLGSGAFGQDAQHQSMPGMQMPEHGTEQMGQMQMHSRQDITSDVVGVQEPENPNQRTGSDLAVPDLLESAKANPAKSLDDFESLALRSNPTLKQAEAIARTSAALAHQAGLWPNPSVGYQGEQIRGGSFGGGEQGAFAQQNIVLGGKLRLRRNVFEQQTKADQIGIEEQKLNVGGAVQMQFYSALAQQRIVDVRRELLGIAMDAATTTHQLANVGQADAPDVLQAELEAEQAKLGYVKAQREYIQRYAQLAAMAGDPQMPLALLKGDLESPPPVDPERYLQDLIANSPVMKRAQQEESRAQAALARDKREAVPDLSLRAGVQQNRELDPSALRPVGAQGFATATVQIPLFNRNQGNVDASKAEVERERQEVERVRLQLMEAAEPWLQQYLTSKLDAERYKTQLIPRARRAYELYLQKYRNMAAAYPEVIVSQRTLFQLEDSYARTLGELWRSVTQLQNYLLADGLSPRQSGGSATQRVNLPGAGSGGTE